ncbi:hypothetical protein BpHYR1_026257, partial [Brachionus plicatilis]
MCDLNKFHFDQKKLSIFFNLCQLVFNCSHETTKFHQSFHSPRASTKADDKQSSINVDRHHLQTSANQAVLSIPRHSQPKLQSDQQPRVAQHAIYSLVPNKDKQTER